MDWEKIKGMFRWDRLKVILRLAGGGLLALLAVIMLFAFIATATAQDMLGQPQYHMRAADVILMWLVILGAGAPGALLLRKAILEVKNKGRGTVGEDAEEDMEEEDEEDMEDDTEEE